MINANKNAVSDKQTRYIFMGFIIIFAVLLYHSLSQFFNAFLGAVIFYILSKRLMERLLKRGWGKSSSAVVVMLITFIIIMIPICIMGFMLYNKGKYYMGHSDQLVASLKKIQSTIKHNYDLEIFSDENIAKIRVFATIAISSFLGESLNFFATITVLYFFLYFMLININRMEAAIVFFLPFKRDKIELFGRELVKLTFSNSVGVPAIAVAQGLTGYIAYLIAGVPEAGFWAVITGFSSIIPIIGTGIVWAPMSIYLLLTHHTWQGIFLFLWGLVILGLTDNVVRFMLAKKMADVHPIITVLGVIMGLKYFGITGIIFGPVLISYFLILLRLYYVQYQAGLPVVSRKKNIPVRFNLPFIGNQIRKKQSSYGNKRSEK